MSIAIPKEADFHAPPAIPDGTHLTDLALAPVNGSSFLESSMIEFQLPQNGYLQPDSLYLAFKVNVTQATASTYMRGAPLYTPFNRLETLLGSQLAEQIQNYNVLANDLVNFTYDTSMKEGVSASLGYGSTIGQTFDSRLISVGTQSFTVAGPIPCAISMCDKLVPLGKMPQVILRLYLDKITNMFNSAGTTSNFSISNVELRYSIVQFDPAVDQMISNVNGDGKFFLKTISWIGTSNTLSSGSQGLNESLYNIRVSSLKSLWSHFSGQDTAKCVNGWYDSIDLSSGNGSIGFTVAGAPVPTREVNLTNNKAEALMELRKALGSIYSKDNTMSINYSEWNYTDASVGTVATTAETPGKWFFGTNCERIYGSNALLSGVSSMNAPITLRLTLGTATTQSYSVYVFGTYDLLIEVDTATRTAIARF